MHGASKLPSFWFIFLTAYNLHAQIMNKITQFFLNLLESQILYLRNCLPVFIEQQQAVVAVVVKVKYLIFQ